MLTVLPLVWIAPPIQWHDQQRIGQVVLGLLSLILLLRHSHRIPVLTPAVRFALAVIVSLGLLSSLFAHQSHWAFTEVAVFALCLAIALGVAAARHVFGRQADRMLLRTLWLVAAGLMAQFLVSYSAALTVDGIGFYPWDMVSGFSNVRFQGHFVSIAIPLVLLPGLLRDTPRAIKASSFLLAALMWMSVFAVGTRGTWLGLGVAAAVLFWYGAEVRRLSFLIVASGLLGWALMQGLFDALPQWILGESKLTTTEKTLTSLSERDIIWKMAFDMALQRPILGYGPMHFADMYNTVAAHPHQSLLQWAAEWGLISAGLVVWIFARAAQGISGQLVANRGSVEPVDVLRGCLAAAALAALTQSMVDGVIVMPYSQLWLCIVLGWLWGLNSDCDKTAPRMRGLLLTGFLVAGGWLVYVIFRDYWMISDPDFMFNDIRDAGFPRFWLYGLIYQGK